MSSSFFEEIEILAVHSQTLLNNLESLKKTKIGNGSPYKEFLRSDIGSKFNKFTTSLQSFSNLSIPAELQAVPKQKSQLFSSVIIDFDYYCNWLQLAEKQLKSFQSQIINPNVRWGLPVLTRICQIFTFYIKSFVSLQEVSDSLLACWVGCRAEKKTACPKEWIDSVILAIRKSPLIFLSEHLSSMKQPLLTIITKLSSLFAQYFDLHSSFEWSAVSDSTNLRKKSTLPPTTLLILQQLSLFRDTVILYSIIFPDVFTDDDQLADLLTRFIVDCPVVILSPTSSMMIADFYTKSPGAPTLKDTILTTARASYRNNSLHIVRLNALIALASNFVENLSLDPNFLAMRSEEIFAFLGASYYELVSCLSKDMDDPQVLQLISYTTKILDMFESFQEQIQRILLYSLVSIDVPYMLDLLALFGQTCTQADKPIIILMDVICMALSKLDLEDFDRGVRYDFYPFLLTHGRMIIYALTKSHGSSSYLYPALEHLLTIRHHVNLCSEPFVSASKICPLKELVPYLPRITRLFKYLNMAESSSLQDIVAFFKYIPVTDASTGCFKMICEEFIKKLISSIFDVIDSSSQNILVSEQYSLSTDFDPETFIQFTSPNRSDEYVKQADKLNQVTHSMLFADQLPDTIQYGNAKINVRMKFITNFYNTIPEKLNEVSKKPEKLQKVLCAMHNFKFIYDSYNIPFESTIFSVIRKKSELENRLQIKEKSIFNPSSSEIFKSYLDNFQKFITTFNEKIVYEPISRCFVGDSRKYEKVYGYKPIKNVIQDFGLSSGVKMNSIINDSIFKSITVIFQSFQMFLNDDYPTIKTNYSINNSSFQFLQSVGTNAQAASSSLLMLGASVLMKKILSESIKDVVEESFPGLYDVTISAFQRCIQNRVKLTKKDKEFLESLSPFKYNYSLSEKCMRIAASKKLNPSQFFFFLALIFTNDKWKDMEYDSKRDVFSYNLHVLPHALEMIISMNELFFPQSDDKQIEEAIKLFFLTLFTISREKMKTQSQKQYLSFVALIDHFQSVTKSIHLNIDDRTFPSFLTRYCYNDL